MAPITWTSEGVRDVGSALVKTHAGCTSET